MASGPALAETVASPPSAMASATAPKAASTTNAILNASARATAAGKVTASDKASTRPARIRQPVRTLARPVLPQREQCAWFWCGRQQTSWLMLGIGF